MSRGKSFTRRRFLKGAAAAAGAPYAITSFSLAGTGRPAPSNRITMGAIGIGSMGGGDLGAFLRHGEVQMVAVCDVDAGHRDAARKRVEGHYARQGGPGTYKGCDAYGDFRDVLYGLHVEARPQNTHDIKPFEILLD